MPKAVLAPRKRRRKCSICLELYRPDPRNHHHQRACSKESCQKTRRGQSQRRWLDNPKNRDHFRGKDNVERVREWRKKHPDYWKGPPRSKSSGTLQDLLDTQLSDNQADPTRLVRLPLQDLLSAQLPVLLGVISILTGCTLQDDIAQSIQRIILRGRDILGIDPEHVSPKKDRSDERKESNPRAPSAPSALAL